MHCEHRKKVSADYTLMEGNESGKLTVKASSFGNQDVYGDVFEANAFDDDVARISSENKLPMLWQHYPDEPIGHWTRAWKDGGYLHMEGQLTRGIPTADRAYLNMKAGDITGISIGFNSIEAKERQDDKGRYEGMTFSKVRLMESSVVTFPANDLARVEQVKGIAHQKREIEEILLKAARDAGISVSRRDVETIVNGSWASLSKNITDERDAGSEENELIDAIRGFDLSL